MKLLDALRVLVLLTMVVAGRVARDAEHSAPPVAQARPERPVAPRPVPRPLPVTPPIPGVLTSATVQPPLAAPLIQVN